MRGTERERDSQREGGEERVKEREREREREVLWTMSLLGKHCIR